MAKAKKNVSPYLKILYKLLENTELGAGEKLLLAYVMNYGIEGTYASNGYLGKVFGVHPRTITYWIKGLKNADKIVVITTRAANKDQQHISRRHIWSKGNYEKRQRTPTQTLSDVGQNLVAPHAKSGSTSAQSLSPISISILEKNNANDSAKTPTAPLDGASSSLLLNSVVQGQAQTPKEDIQALKARVFGGKSVARLAQTPKEADKIKAEWKALVEQQKQGKAVAGCGGL